MFIEGLRTDSLYLHIFGLDIRISQVVGFVTFIVGLTLMIINLLRVKKLENGKLAEAYYGKKESSSYEFNTNTEDESVDAAKEVAKDKADDMSDTAGEVAEEVSEAVDDKAAEADKAVDDVADTITDTDAKEDENG